MTETTTIKIHVSSALCDYCGGVPEFSLPAASVRSALELIEQSQPSLYRGICDETGTVRRHINLFVNAAHVRDLDGLDTALRPGDIVTVLPAISGG